MYSFTAVNDIDLDYYEYQLYDNSTGAGSPIKTGRAKANVFTVAVTNSSDSVITTYSGRVRTVSTSGAQSSWSSIVASGNTPLIESQYINSLTANKITAGKIGAHTIELEGATSIIKSSLFNGTLSGSGTYTGATRGWLINGTGNLYSTTGKIGPVNIASTNMNSQGSSPYLNSDNNYYRFDQFGDISVFSNPGSDVAPGGVHLNQFHKTNIVGEYINVQKHSNASFNTSPALFGAFMGNATGNAMEFSLTEGSITKFIVTTAGNLNVTGTISGAVKSFEIDHPLYPDKKLVHASIEGPTLDVFYRGTSQLINGEVEIELPEYFEALTKKEERTVLLSPEIDSTNAQVAQIAYSAINNGKFKVFEVNGPKNPFQKFSWLVMAIRLDTDFEVVKSK